MKNSLRSIHSWLTLREAAQSLSEALGQPVSVADVLRMALDEALWLSVLIPSGTKASLLVEEAGQIVQQPAKLEGCAKLVRDDVGKRQVQSEMHWQANLPFISMQGTPGALVSQGGKLYRLQPDRGATGFSPRSPSSLPHDVQLGVAQADLQALLATLKERLQPSEATPSAPASNPQEPAVDESAEEHVNPKTRETLLLMIAALARAQNIDITRASKAGETIAVLISELGHERTSRALSTHLRNAAKLLPEGRSK